MTLTPRVLVVDDDEPMRLSLESLCSSLGWSVEVADSAEEAFSELSRRKFDVVISDVQMPNAGGPDLIRWMDEENIRVPIVLMSGESSYTLEWAAALGARAFLAKPFGPDALKSTVDRVLRWEPLETE